MRKGQFPFIWTFFIWKASLTRNPEHYKVNFARTKRYGSSTIPTLQRLLNSEELKKKISLRNFGC